MRYLFFCIALLTAALASAQCSVTSIPINTGFDPSTGAAIAPGSATTPVTDPYWIVTASNNIPGAATAGSPAYIVTRVSGWAANPATSPGNWISVIPSNTYNTDGAGTAHNMTLTRPFRMCTADSIRLTLYIANDNYISNTDIDGTALAFSQGAATTTTFYSTFTAFTQTVYLSAGTHYLNVLVNNYNLTYATANPSGLNIYGSLSSATNTPSIVYQSDTSCNSYGCSLPACGVINMADSVTVCADSTVSLAASFSGTDSVTSVRWWPPTGLSDTTIFSPTLTTGATSRYYRLTVASAIAGNLIANGSFTYGNSGFNTDYRYAASATGNGDYGIGPNARAFNGAWSAAGDHTTGTGNMMIVDGGTRGGLSTWCFTLNVTPNTYYNFSAWFMNLYITSPPNIQVYVNGSMLGSTLTPSAVGTWVNFASTWYSGSATMATICIINTNTAGFGNDFAIDDISLTQSCVVTDSVYVNVLPNPRVRLGNDTTMCAIGGSVTLQSSVAYTGATYRWSNGATTPSITPTTTGSYSLRVNLSGCTAMDTVNVTYKPNPLVRLGADTSVCVGASIAVNTPPGSLVRYLWNTGATSPAITVPATGVYWVQVDSNGCLGRDTIAVTVYPDFVVDLGIDTAYCGVDSAVLQSRYTYTGATYLWSNGSTTPSITVGTTGTYSLTVTVGVCSHTDSKTINITPDYSVHLGNDTLICEAVSKILQSTDVYPSSATYVWSTGATTPAEIIDTTGTYWLMVMQGGCWRADTINIRIVYDSLTVLSNDTAICLGKQVQAFVDSRESGATYTYQWLPTSGIAFSTLLQPLISPDTSATYIIQASTPGCPPVMDSFHIDVQPNPTVYAGGNRFVCEFDTLRLTAEVSPRWYNGYWYNWSPAANLDNYAVQDPVFTAGGTQKYIVTVSTSAGCIGKDSLLVSVNPGNFATLSPDTAVCPHDSARLVAAGGVTYRWSPVMYLSDSTAATPWVHAITAQHYTVIATSAAGCKDTLGVYVNVYPNAVISLPDSVRLYPGESYHLQPYTNCATLQWFPPFGLDDASKADPIVTPLSNTRYQVFGVTENGCKTADTIMVYADPNTLLDVPNAFTPGADGTNDVLYIIKRGQANLKHFRIYNRWGNLVFETKDINEGWDGRYKGTPQPFGVYVYDVEATTLSGVPFNKHGNVTLIR